MSKKEKDVSNKHVWVKKSDNLCLVAPTALKFLDTCLWYLDSACSKHMTGDRALLKDIQMARGGRITFGDGSQAKVIGNGQINIPGLEVSQKALYVEGLKANLLSISQLCDDDLVVQFSKKECNIFDSNGKRLMGGERTSDNCYGIPNLSSDSQIICNKATIDESELWHQRLGHLNFTNMFKIASMEVVKDLPKMKDTWKGVYGPCQLGKQTRTTHKKTSGILTSSNLELLHMDLMGPTRTSSLDGKKYILVIVDDYSRYTWVLLIREKSDAFEAAQQLFNKIQIEQNSHIMRIRSDHGKEFENARFEEYCHSYGIQQEFSSPITPQQNGVLERKNIVLQEMARVMIHSQNLAQHFWGEVINTACHIINRVYLRPETSKTPYQIWRGKKPTVKYFRTFGSICYILRDRENLGKFDPKSDESIFLGYSTNSCAYKVYNTRTETVMESINVVIDDEIGAHSKGKISQSTLETLPSLTCNVSETSSAAIEPVSILLISPTAIDVLPNSPDSVPSEETDSTSDQDLEPINPPIEPASWVKLNHPSRQLIGNLNEGRRLRSRIINPSNEIANQVTYNCYWA
jgi:hypothetical protein